MRSGRGNRLSASQWLAVLAVICTLLPLADFQGPWLSIALILLALAVFVRQ